MDVLIYSDYSFFRLLSYINRSNNGYVPTRCSIILWTDTNTLIYSLEKGVLCKIQIYAMFHFEKHLACFLGHIQFWKKIQKQSDIEGTGSYSFQHLFCFLSRNNDKYKITFHTVWNCFGLAHMRTWKNITVEVISKGRYWLIGFFKLIFEVYVQHNHGHSL